MKQEVLALKEELEKLAEDNEKAVTTKCAEYLLAASGLHMLKSRLTVKEASSGLAQVARKIKGSQKPLSAKFNLKQYNMKKKR